jgi:hypothetical protein
MYSINRRDFLGLGAASLGSLLVPKVEASQSERAILPESLGQMMKQNEYYQAGSTQKILTGANMGDMDLVSPTLRLTAPVYNKAGFWMASISNVCAGVARPFWIRLGATTQEMKLKQQQLVIQETRADTKTLQSYHMIEKFNDNKVANLLMAAIELCKHMSQQGIEPNSEFDFWKDAHISKLIDGGFAEWGAGIGGDRNGNRYFVDMYAGGICAFATALAKAAWHASQQNQVKFSKPLSAHSMDGYVNNPFDPYAPDVTVTDTKHLSFVNTTDKPLYVLPRIQVFDRKSTEWFDPIKRGPRFTPRPIHTQMDIEMILTHNQPTLQDIALLISELAEHLSRPKVKGLENTKKYLDQLTKS